jgi:hypothetical protein
MSPPALGLRGRMGFILPFVLLATLAVTSLALAALALARAEHLAAEWERGRLAALADAGSGEGVGAGSLDEVATPGHGYRVVAPPHPTRAGTGLPGAFLSPLRLHRVAWCLDPEEEADGPWWTAGSPPRLGPLGVPALVDLLLRLPGSLTGDVIVLPGVVEGDSMRLRGEPGPGVGAGTGVEARGAFRVTVAPGPGGGFLVVAEGSLRVGGTGTLAGVVLTEGDAVVDVGTEVVGGIRAGGRILRDPGLTAPAEDLRSPGGGPASRAFRTAALGALPTCPHPLWDGGRLGYF